MKGSIVENRLKRGARSIETPSVLYLMEGKKENLARYIPSFVDSVSNHGHKWAKINKGLVEARSHGQEDVRQISKTGYFEVKDDGKMYIHFSRNIVYFSDFDLRSEKIAVDESLTGKCVF